MGKLDTELTRLGKPHQFFTYPGADHAFMDHTGPRYHRDSAELSWPRTLQFFATHLKERLYRLSDKANLILKELNKWQE